MKCDSKVSYVYCIDTDRAGAQAGREEKNGNTEIS
jgi:hypothetical protein